MRDAHVPTPQRCPSHATRRSQIAAHQPPAVTWWRSQPRRKKLDLPPRRLTRHAPQPLARASPCLGLSRSPLAHRQDRDANISTVPSPPRRRRRVATASPAPQRGYYEATTRLLRGYYEATTWLPRGYYEATTLSDLIYLIFLSFHDR